MAAWQFAAPLSAPVVFPFSETFYARAVDSAAAGKSAEALAWADKATHASPARAENWVLLAYVYETIDRRISPRVIDTMRKSYEVGPLAFEAHDFRLSQVFGNWDQYPSDIQRLAFAEAKTYGQDLYSGRVRLESMLPTIRNPRGHFVLGVIIVTAKTQQDIRYRQETAITGR